MRLIEQNRHFAQHRARLGDDRNHGIAFDDLKPSLDQHIEVSGRTALVDNERSRQDVLLNSPRAIVENRAHPVTLQGLAPRHHSRPGARLGRESCYRRTDNAFDLLKLFASTEISGPVRGLAMTRQPVWLSDPA